MNIWILKVGIVTSYFIFYTLVEFGVCHYLMRVEQRVSKAALQVEAETAGPCFTQLEQHVSKATSEVEAESANAVAPEGACGPVHAATSSDVACCALMDSNALGKAGSASLEKPKFVVPTRSVACADISGDIDDVLWDEPIEQVLVVTDALCGQPVGNVCHHVIDELFYIGSDPAWPGQAVDVETPSVALEIAELGTGTGNDEGNGERRMPCMNFPDVGPSMHAHAGCNRSDTLRKAAFPAQDHGDKLSQEEQAVSKMPAAAVSTVELDGKEKQLASKVAALTTELGGDEKQAAPKAAFALCPKVELGGEEMHEAPRIAAATLPSEKLGDDEMQEKSKLPVAVPPMVEPIGKEKQVASKMPVTIFPTVELGCEEKQDPSTKLPAAALFTGPFQQAGRVVSRVSEADQAASKTSEDRQLSSKVPVTTFPTVELGCEEKPAPSKLPASALFTWTHQQAARVVSRASEVDQVASIASEEMQVASKVPVTTFPTVELGCEDQQAPSKPRAAAIFTWTRQQAERVVSRAGEADQASPQVSEERQLASKVPVTTFPTVELGSEEQQAPPTKLPAAALLTWTCQQAGRVVSRVSEADQAASMLLASKVTVTTFPTVELGGEEKQAALTRGEEMQTTSAMLPVAAFPTLELGAVDRRIDSKAAQEKRAASTVPVVAAFPTVQLGVEDKQAASKLPAAAFPTEDLGGEDMWAASHAPHETHVSAKTPIATFPTVELGLDVCGEAPWWKWEMLRVGNKEACEKQAASKVPIATFKTVELGSTDETTDFAMQFAVKVKERLCTFDRLMLSPRAVLLIRAYHLDIFSRYVYLAAYVAILVYFMRQRPPSPALHSTLGECTSMKHLPC